MVLQENITSFGFMRETATACVPYNITNKLCSIVVFAASKRENTGHRFREIFGILNIYCEVYTANIKVNYMIRLYRNGVT